ncbi:MAG: ATP-binding cassette domain-containing protein [Prevotellaceae bacterium]|jgi:cell division transport system ATP-binding protein|nr:ATP-binding cassette domain-containing protein [Prevotellaceae bacterium]
MGKVVIDFKDVDVCQKDLKVLSDVNFSMNKGQFVYLIGRVGSGKSSLIKAITGEIPVYKGEATVLDFKLNRLKSKYIPNLRRKIGVVFQDFQLLTDRHVYDNLAFVLRSTGWTNKGEIQARIEEVLAMVGLSDKSDSMPYRLSGGEQQRVAIARAMLNDPEIILADEPTGNLDPDTSANIMSIIHELSKTFGITVLMATHNYNILKNYPSEILKCEDGKLMKTVMPSEEDLKNKLIKFGLSRGYEYELVYQTVMRMYGTSGFEL